MLMRCIKCSLLVIPAKTDSDFKAFLDERNPKQQHSSTLESYLIKPIQRVLKYPLLLKELYSLTDPDSEEHYHLDGKPQFTCQTEYIKSFWQGRTWVNTYGHNSLTLTTLFAVAMKAMNKVASHINEMQKIHEEFGAVFDQLITEQSGEKKEVCWTNVA